MSKSKNEIIDFPEEFKGQSNPIELLKLWLEDAQKTGLRDPNAMILSTVNAAGQPSSRVLLCKEITDHSLLFYTNYDSDKAKEMDHNKKVAVNFFWHELHRQIRIQGIVTKTSYQKSNEYWQTRPRGSQLSQLMSKQSQTVSSREQMESELAMTESKYKDITIPCPTNWGGYELNIELFEYWIGRESRFHDRITFTKVENHWVANRLYP